MTTARVHKVERYPDGHLVVLGTYDDVPDPEGGSRLFAVSGHESEVGSTDRERMAYWRGLLEAAHPERRPLPPSPQVLYERQEPAPPDPAA